MSIDTVYKVVHVTPDGKFESVFCGQPTSNTYGRKLTYIMNKLTEAPTDSQGIYCWKTKEQAIQHAYGSASLIVYPPTEVLEVCPIGTQTIDSRLDKEGSVCYPAVVPIKVVWNRETEVVYKFKPGDKVMIDPKIKAEDVVYGAGLLPNNYGIVESGFKSFRVKGIGGEPAYIVTVLGGKGCLYLESQLVPYKEPPRFKVGDKVRFKEEVKTPSACAPSSLVGKVEEVKGYGSDLYVVVNFGSSWDTWGCLKSELELAPPEPIWVDVTDQCSVETLRTAKGIMGLVKHGSLILGWLGIGDFDPIVRTRGNNVGQYSFGKNQAAASIQTSYLVVKQRVS